MFNNKIKQLFDKYNIYWDDGITYLLSKYYELDSKVFPLPLINKIKLTNILHNNKFQIPLFEKEELKFDWISTYINMFKEVNPDKKSNIRNVEVRFKWFFKEYSGEYNKDDILKATEEYLKNTNPMYIREPHYFIKKGNGTNLTSDLLTWLEKIKSENEDIPQSLENKMQ